MLKITVILPTYKPQIYLDECLESLDSQTFHKEWYEVMVILNGEKEPYYSDISGKLQHYSFQYELLYTQAVGVSNARNVGLDHARGEYICFIDDDDFVSPAYLEGLYRAITGHTGAIAVSNVSTFRNRDDKTFGKDYIGLAFERFSRELTKSLFKKRKFLSSNCCKLIPREIIKGGRFRPGFRLGEDSLFMFEISDRIQDIVLSPEEAVYYRRLRSGSVSRRTYSAVFIRKNKICLIKSYIRIYMEGILRYNILFFISRIVAVIGRH